MWGNNSYDESKDRRDTGKDWVLDPKKQKTFGIGVQNYPRTN